MIIRLCGTSGSGKTTVARELMGRAPIRLGDPKRPSAYKVPKGYGKPLFIIGPYTNTCGGVDSLSGWKECMDMVHLYQREGHVFYESLLLSTYYGQQGLETKQYGKDHVWAFLDTPIEVCIERIKARRLAAGNTKPLNEDNTRNRVRTIDNLRRRVTDLGHRVVVIPYLHAVYAVKELLI